MIAYGADIGIVAAELVQQVQQLIASQALDTAATHLVGQVAQLRQGFLFINRRVVTWIPIK